MKATLALAGKRAETVVDFALPSGEKTPVALRPITQFEEAAAIEYAMTFARTRGLESPDYGSALFDIGLRAHVCATAALDVDSPPDAREPFFPSADFIVANYQADAILFLHQHQRAWQDQCSPLWRAKTEAELHVICRQLSMEVDESHRFFSTLSPLTQATCARYTASRLFALQAAKSSPTLPSVETPPP